MNIQKFTFSAVCAATALFIGSQANAQSVFDLSTNQTPKIYGIATGGAKPDLTTDVTFSAWIYQSVVSSTSYFPIIFGDHSATGIGNFFRLEYNNGGNYLYYGQWNGSSFVKAYAASAIPLNTWTHVAMVKLATGNLTFYINGVAQTTTYTTGTSFNNNSNGDNLTIGGGFQNNATINNQFFTGKIDNAVVYSSARSAAQILSEYQGGVDITDPAIWAVWKFNDQANPTADYATASGHTAHPLNLTAATPPTSYFATGAPAGDNTLAVTYASFSVSSLAKSVQLAWSTLSEVNNAYFRIERSTNAKDWKTIGTVNGVGNSNSLSSYSFEDASPINGTGYYRLVQFNLNGTSEISETKSIEFTTAKASVKLYPNPASSELHIESSEPIKSFRISGLNGVDYTSSVKLQTSSSSTVVNISQLPIGIYIVSLNAATYKIVKANN